MEGEYSSIERKIVFFTVVLLHVSLVHVKASPYQVQRIITPTWSNCSEGDTCITLTECLHNVDFCFNSKAVVTFLPGDHYTNGVSGLVTVKYVDDLTITGHGKDGVPAVRVHCNSRVGFAFVQVRNLSISGIEFHRCGFAIPKDLKNEAFRVQTHTYFIMFENTKSALFLVNVLNLNASQLHVYHSDGYGLFAMNILGFSVISDSGFYYNNYGALDYHQRNPWFCRAEAVQNTSSCSGGNAVFLYQDTPNCPQNTHTYVA